MDGKQFVRLSETARNQKKNADSLALRTQDEDGDGDAEAPTLTLETEMTAEMHAISLFTSDCYNFSEDGKKGKAVSILFYFLIVELLRS